MFKKIVSFISTINTPEDIDTAYGMIETAYQHEKISWADHEMLYALVAKIRVD